MTWIVLPDFHLQIRSAGALAWVMGASATLMCLKEHWVPMFKHLTSHIRLLDCGGSSPGLVTGKAGEVLIKVGQSL